ncbi:MAG: membrane protein insertase YidC, partial [Treponema sp.]|nr:membrane protein insertase YidC [Treponema sp.]
KPGPSSGQTSTESSGSTGTSGLSASGGGTTGGNTGGNTNVNTGGTTGGGAGSNTGGNVTVSTGDQNAVSSVPSTSQPEVQEATVNAAVPAQTVTIETDVIKVTLTNVGGEIKSFQLKNYKESNSGEPVDMIFRGNNEPQAFAVAFGNAQDVMANKIRPEEQNFRVKMISDLIVEFSQDFTTASGGSFTLVKRYEFKPGEYMFELTITLDGGRSVDSFDFQGAAYTLFYGPQIGPKFEKLDQRYEYRHYLTYKGKLKTEKVTERDPLVVTTQPSWAAIAGKYFTLIALPYANQYDIGFSAQNENGIPAASRLYITRPAQNISRVEDKYQFYLGPKNQETLTIYETGVNAYKLRDTGLVEVANTRGFLAPLETLLKWLLMFFYKFIPNYGIAIILLTVLVKLLMFPLTKKGSESTMRMQTLSPKIKEIQEKYKGNPQKMNAEMAEFYKKEGYNPLSGCLPMIIQIPIFFAMYNLFNNHFDLRGAIFIPVWIPDLSLPESIYNFPDNFRLPILGWNALRLLPFIYVGSQLLYGKVTQTPDQQGNAQMKIMLYAMPIVFFFILYDVPSGLLIYWIMSNVLTMVQQLSINKYIAKKKAAAVVPESKPVIAPGPSRKKKKK